MLLKALPNIKKNHFRNRTVIPNSIYLNTNTAYNTAHSNSFRIDNNYIDNIQNASETYTVIIKICIGNNQTIFE